MSYSDRMQRNHLVSIYLAPRGYPRMADQGTQIGQLYLSPFDLLIGVIGDAGSGKSMLIKGMFPGLELTNDDEGLNVRPLPIMELEEDSFFSARTYHIDMNFESAFYQMHDIVRAIQRALDMKKRVVIEHFDMVYPALKRNADLLIGIGEEIIITRPTQFGPEPEEVRRIVYKSIIYRKMAHTAEELFSIALEKQGILEYRHSEVRHGFLMLFDEKPEIDMVRLRNDVQELIDQKLPVAYKNDNHIIIGDMVRACQGPRMHMNNTGDIHEFTIYPELTQDPFTRSYMLLAIVGSVQIGNLGVINTLFDQYNDRG